MKDNSEVPKKLEELARSKLNESLSKSKLEEKQFLRETSCNEYQNAAGIRATYARRYRQDGELEKSITEYLKSAEDYIQSGKIYSEDNKDEKATICFDQAITQYSLAGRDDLISDIHKEYGQFGTRKQLNLGLKMYFPLDD